MDGFDQFWASYKRKENKQPARDWFRWAMQNHNGDGQLLARILETLAWQAVAQPERRFWLTPDKWLARCKWEDECPDEIRAALVLASESPEERAARRARVEAESAARFQRERTLAFPERRGA